MHSSNTLELETKKASTVAEAFLKCAPVDSLMQILKAPPVGEELDPKTSELTESASSFYHSSTNAQLFELLENLKAELLKRSNNG